jgi:glycosyltransferase involved in cell wall biosynthesis
MARKPRLVLSANAVPGSGGQGLNEQHMLEAYGPIADVTAFDRRSIPKSRLEWLVWKFPLTRYRADLATLAADVSFDRHVARRLETLEAVDVFQGAVGQSALSLAAARRRGLRTVLDVVNHHVDDYVDHVEREARRFGHRGFIHPEMRRRILREYDAADVIRVMSKVSARTFEERGPSGMARKVVVAAPPMDVSQFPIAKFDDDVFRIVFVGLVQPWKGFHLLVEAFDRLRLPKSELVIWGGAGTRGTSRFLKEKTAKNPAIVVRPVAIRTVGLAEVYGKASVLVHPSLSDGFAYVVAEALASGLPVIVTENTGASDLVREGENGFVVKTGDVRALEERIEHLYRHREKLPEMGRKARAAAATLTMDAFRGVMARAIGVDVADGRVQRITSE